MLDTWFSSGAVAVLHAGLAGRDRRTCAAFYPTSVLVTGYDILFFWVARMMMFGLYAMDGEQPFDTVALHGLVRDEHGKKMSKSFGNIVDPLDWIDALRRRRAAVHPGPRRQPGRRRADRRGVGARARATSATSSGTPPGSRCSTARRSSGALPAAAELSDRRPVDPVPAARRSSREVDALLRATSSSPRSPTRSTTSPGTRSATGTSSWPRRRWPPAARRPTRTRRGARPRARRAAAAAAPGRPVRHRGAVDGADRRRVARGRALAGEPSRAGRRRRGGARSPTLQKRGHRGPPVPLRAGAAARRSGSPPGSTGLGDRRARRARAADPVAGPAGRAGRRVRADRDAGGAGRRSPSSSTSSGAIDVAAERARLDQGPGRRARRSSTQRRGEAGQPGVRRQGAGAGRRRRSADAAGRGRGRHRRGSTRGQLGARCPSAT